MASGITPVMTNRSLALTTSASAAASFSSFRLVNPLKASYSMPPGNTEVFTGRL